MSLLTDIVTIHPYLPTWPIFFIKESEKIQKALGKNCLNIHHIGSTSVPRLSAKPVIDIIAVVQNIQHVDDVTFKMQTLGYQSKGEHGMIFRRFFQKSDFNVHVYEVNNAEIERCLHFRDWMRAHPQDRQAYEALKIRLAKEFPNNRLEYSIQKEPFILAIEQKTGFSGARIVKALTPFQWQAYHRLQKIPQRPFPMINDEWHFHFVLYQGVYIVGAAYLEKLSKKALTLHALEIDEQYPQTFLKAYMIQTLTRWAEHQHCALRLES